MPEINRTARVAALLAAVATGLLGISASGCRRAADSASDSKDTARGKPHEAPASGSGENSPYPQIDALVRPLVEARWAQAVVVGVVQDGQTSLLSYGQLSSADSAAPGEDTLFEIGSLSKVFTGLLLAEAVSRGDLALTSFAGEWLPEEAPVPRRGATPIRLVDLATHSSGLPLIPQNFWGDSPGAAIFDPNAAGRTWTNYTVEQLYAYLREPQPPIADEAKFVYSNLGVGLLGHILELQSGQDYEQLLRERICEPLGLRDTCLTPNAEQLERLAPGHDADQTPTDPWKAGRSALRGAFAIRSTPRDLLQLIKACLEPPEGSLGKAIQLAQQSHFHRSDVEQSGLGWNLNKFGVIHHSGTTGGYRCAVFLLPARKTGVVILANSLIGGSTDARSGYFEQLSGSLLNVLVGAPPLVGPLPAVALEAGTPLTEYVGAYRLTDSPITVVVSVEQDGLWCLLPGRVPRRLYPAAVADDTFLMKAYDAQLAFLRGPGGGISGVDLNLGGSRIKLPRSSEPPRTP